MRLKNQYFIDQNDGSLARNFRMLFIRTVILLLFFFVAVYLVNYNHRKTRDTGDLVLKTEGFILQSENTISLVKDYEASARGFVITNNEEFLQPVKNSRNEIETSLLNLKQLAGSNRSEVKAIESIAGVIHKKLDVSDRAIQLRRDSGFSAAMQWVSSGIGKRYMDTIRLLQLQLKQNESDLLWRRQAESNNAIFINRLTLLAILLIFFVLLVVLFWQGWFNLKDYNEKQKDVNELLGKLAERLINAQKIGHIGSWEWSWETNEEIWSDEQYRIFGFEPGITKITHELFLHAVHIHDRELVEAAFENAIKKQASVNIRFRILRPDGEIRFVSAIGEFIKEPAKQHKLLGTLQDVTILAQKEKELESLAFKLTKTNKVARVGWWESDTTTGKRIWSSVTKEILEVPENFEPINDLEFSFVGNNPNKELLENCFSKAVLNGDAYDITIPLQTAKGKNIVVRIIGQPEFEEGKCKRVFGILQDITLQHDALSKK